MIRLRVLGAVDLRDANGTELRELLVQPKRTALLAYLAVGQAGALHRRDTLLALFWPESDREHARGALSQALTYVRQVLGPAVLNARGSEEVGLDPEYFWCDARAFDAEFAASRYEEALGYYRDHLLAGFHASTSSAFEDWLSSERSRLLDRATRASWALAERDVEQRLTSSACQWARRAIELAPCNESDVYSFLVSLHRVGDDAGAIRTYEVFAEHLRRQYDIDPTPETRELVAAIRRQRADISTMPNAAAGVRAAVAPSAQVREDRQATPARSRMPLRPRRVAVAGGLIVLATAAVALTMREQPPAIVPGEAMAVTTELGIELFPSLSPDGRLVAYTATAPRNTKVLVRAVAGGRAIAIAEDSATPYWGPKWSPDGSAILVRSPGKVWLVSPTGGSLREVLSVVPWTLRFVGWSPDARQLMFVRNDSLLTRALEARDERFVGFSRLLHSCDWSRRGLIACVVGNVEFGQLLYAFANIAPSHIVVFSLRGGPAIAVTDSASMHLSPAWSPDGNWLYFVSNRQGARDIYAVRISSRGAAEGEARRLTTGANVMSIALASDGTRLAYAVFTPKTNIGSIPWRSAGVETRVKAHTFGSQVVEYMKVSHDGQWLYYDSNLRGNADIYRVRTSGGEPQQLTFDRADDFNPDVSADGRHVAFHSVRSGNRDVFVMPAEGGDAQQVTFTSTDEFGPRWSPDGLSLAFRGDFTLERPYIAHRTANGRWTQRSFWARGLQPEWSPDGRRLVLMGPAPPRAPTGPSRRPILVAPLDSGRARVLYAPAPGDPQPTNPVWSSDGAEILFKTTADGRIAFWAVPIVGGRPRLLAQVDSSLRSFNLAWATDGKRFYFPVEDHQTDIWVMELRRER